MKLISQCCVCGKVYAVKKCYCKGVDDNEERVSHGYCSTECMNSTPVEASVWMDNLRMFTIVTGFLVGDKVYHDGKLVGNIIDVLEAVAEQKAMKKGA